MLEGLLEKLLLNRLKLGEWIEGLDRSKLKVDIWSGSIQLTSLTLQSEAIRKFDLPFVVKYGHIEHLSITIPWNALKSQPVKIAVKGVYLLLAPKTEQDLQREAGNGTAGEKEKQSGSSTVSALQSREHEQHIAHIQESEQLRQLSKMNSSEAEAQAGFIEQMISLIVTNLEVSVEKLHIRMENPQPTTLSARPSSPLSSSLLLPRQMPDSDTPQPMPLSFAAGLTIASLTATTTDANGTSRFISNDSKKNASSGPANFDKIHKTLKCVDVAVYCNPGARSWSTLPPAALRVSFSNSIAQSSDQQWWKNNSLKSSLHRFSFIFLPLSPKIILHLNRSNDFTIPYAAVQISLPELPVALTNEQVKALLEFAEGLSTKRIQARGELLAIISHCKVIKPTSPPFPAPIVQAVASSGKSKKKNKGKSSMPTSAAGSSSASAAAAASSSNIKAWWRWAYECVVLIASTRRQHRLAQTSASSLGKKQGRLTILDKARLFKAYLPLYKRSTGASWLTALSDAEQARMTDIELQLEVRDIMFYRNMAEAELSTEAKNQQRLMEYEKTQNAKRGYVASWYGYLSGTDKKKQKATAEASSSSSPSSSSSSDSSVPGIEISQEQREALLEMLGTPASKVNAVALPPNYVLYRLQVDVDTLNVTFNELDPSTVSPDTPSAAEQSVGLCRTTIKGLKTAVDVQPISSTAPAIGRPLKASFAIDSFAVQDLISNQPIYDCVAASDPNAATASSKSASSSPSPFLQGVYEQKPFMAKEGDVGASASSSAIASSSSPSASSASPLSKAIAHHQLHLSLQPFQLVCNPYFIARFIRFFPNLYPPIVIPSQQGDSHGDFASSSSAAPALRDLASALTMEMQSDFMRSLSTKRSWDIKIQSERMRILAPRHWNESQALTNSTESELLVFSSGKAVIRSHSEHEPKAKDDANSDDADASHSGHQPVLLRRHLPAAIEKHPAAYDRFTLSIHHLQLALWRSKEVYEASLSKQSSNKDAAPHQPSLSCLYVLTPLSLHLSLHVCVRTGLLDLEGKKLLLPRSVLSGFIPAVELQLTQRSIVFAAGWVANMKDAIVAAKMEDRLGLSEVIQPPSARIDADQNIIDAPASIPISPSAVASTVVVLPAVRTQFHGYCGLGRVSCTFFSESKSKSKSASASKAAHVFTPLLRVSGHGCSSLFVASSLETQLQLGLESAQVEDVTQGLHPDHAQSIVSVTSKHLSNAPGGAAGITSLLRSPSLVVTADSEALQIRIVTLLGAALRCRPSQYADRPAAKQYVDCGISCIQVDWSPQFMMTALRWAKQIEFPNNSKSVEPASVSESADEEQFKAAPASSSSSSSSSSTYIPSRFLSLLTARIEEFSFRCLPEKDDPRHSLSPSLVRSPSKQSPKQHSPTALFQLDMNELYLKQGIYARNAQHAAPIDHLVVAGIKECVLYDSMEIRGRPNAYTELLSCKIQQELQDEMEEFDHEDDDAEEHDEKKSDENRSSVHDAEDLQHIASHLRPLLPIKPYPLLLTIDACTNASKRYQGKETNMTVSVQGVRAVYVRERLDQLLDYFTSGALGILSSSSSYSLANRMSTVLHQHTSIHFSTRNPTLIIPRSNHFQHENQLICVDLGQIQVQADWKVCAPEEFYAQQVASAQLYSDEAPDLWLPHKGSELLFTTDVHMQLTQMKVTAPFGSPRQDVSAFVGPPGSAPVETAGESSLTPLVEDVNFRLHCTLQYPLRFQKGTSGSSSSSSSDSGPESFHPHVVVRSSLSDITLRISRLQNLLLQRIAFENLLVGMSFEPELAAELPAYPTSASSIPAAVRQPNESKEDVEDRLGRMVRSPSASPVTPSLVAVAYRPMSMDVRFHLNRLRVELLAPPPAVKGSFAPKFKQQQLVAFCYLSIDEMDLETRMSAERAIVVNLNTKKMSIVDCSNIDNPRTIFYPLPNAAADAVSADPLDPAIHSDELLLSWLRQAPNNPSAFPDGAPSVVADRLMLAISHPCVLVLPEFWIRMMQFVKSEEGEELTERFESSAVKQSRQESWLEKSSLPDGLSPAASSPLPPARAPRSVVNKKPPYFLDLDISVLNARAVVPQSNAMDAPALVVTCDVVFSSKNEFPQHHDSLLRTQEFEVTLTNIQVFGGRVDRPLVATLPHRIFSCNKIQAMFHSSVSEIQAGSVEEDDHKAIMAINPRYRPNTATSTITTAAIQLEPIAVQFSYMDAVTLRRIGEFFQMKFEAFQQEKAALDEEEHKKNEPQGQRQQQAQAAIASQFLQEWKSAEVQHHVSQLQQQNNFYSDQPCVIVPKVIPPDAIDEQNFAETASSTTKRSSPSAAKRATNAAAFATKQDSIVTIGWFQLIEVNCASVSLILLNDIALKELDTQALSASSLSTGVGSVPLFHLCVYDCRVVWSHPRAHRQSSSTSVTDMIVATVHANLSLTAFDAANVEWNTVIDSCPYEVAVQIQTDRGSESEPRPQSTQTPGGPAASPSPLLTEESLAEKRSISVEFRATQSQDVHISDRFLSSLAQVYHDLDQEVQRWKKIESDAEKQLASISASSSSPTLIHHVRRSFFAPFILSNLTHRSLNVAVETINPELNPTTIVQHGEEIPLAFPEAALDTHSDGHASWTYCNFEFGSSKWEQEEEKQLDAAGPTDCSPFLPLLHVPVSKIGTLVYELRLANNGAASGTYVQIVISMANASKKIEVKSMHCLSNSTGLPLEVRLVQMGASVLPDRTHLELGVIEPTQTIYLPLDEPTFSWSLIQFRPFGFGMEWNGESRAKTEARKPGEDLSQNSPLASQLIRFAMLQKDRSTIVTVNQIEGEAAIAAAAAMEPGGGSGDAAPQIPTFVCHAAIRATKHQATVLLTNSGAGAKKSDASGSASSSSSSAPTLITDVPVEGIMQYQRLFIDIHPPLTLSNLMLYDLNYQIKYRAVGAQTLLAAGSMKPGDKISIHEVEQSRYPLVRFQLVTASPAAAVPQPWSDWMGMEQVQGKPVVEFPAQVQQAPPFPPIPLLMQVHRGMQAYTGTVNISFSVPFWLNNQSGIDLSFTVPEEMFENERFIFFKWRAPSLPTDREQWTDRSGNVAKTPPHLANAAAASSSSSSVAANAAGSNNPAVQLAAAVIPTNPDYMWLKDNNWVVDVVPGQTDDQGWRYALDFPGPYSSSNSALDAVRRRRWIRHRALRDLKCGWKIDAQGNAVDALSSQPGGAVGAASLTPQQMQQAFSHLRMFGCHIGHSPVFSVYPTGTHMPPSAAIDFRGAATDSLLVIAEPMSHRAPGNAVRTYEMAVLIDHAPAPFQKSKIISFHPRYQLHNQTPLALFVRQVGLDQRNARFISELAAGQTKPFHPWLCTPPVTGPNAGQPVKMGIHLCVDGSPWSTPFPIQRIGEFTIKFPVKPAPAQSGASGSSQQVVAAPRTIPAMFMFRVKVELVRTIVHVYITPESNFLVSPSLLLAPPTSVLQSSSGSSSVLVSAIQPSVNTGSLYRIDNHTKHQFFVHQPPLESSPTFDFQRTANSLAILPHSSLVYAFDHFDLSQVSNGSGNNAASSSAKPNLRKGESKTAICIELEWHFSEIERLQLMEMEFNGQLSFSHIQTAWTKMAFDSVSAQTYFKQPNGLRVVPSLNNDGSSRLVSRCVHLRIETDGPTRVLVIRELDFDETAEDEKRAVKQIRLTHRKARRDASNVAESNEDGNDTDEEDDEDIMNSNQTATTFTALFALKEVNISLFSAGEFLPTVISAASRPAGAGAVPTASEVMSSPSSSSSRNAVQRIARKTMSLSKKLRGRGDSESSGAGPNREVLFIQLTNFAINAKLDTTAVGVQLRLGKFQIDNPMTNPIFPVVMHSMQDTRQSGPEANASANALVPFHQQHPAIVIFLSAPRSTLFGPSDATPTALAAAAAGPVRINRFLFHLHPFRLNLDEPMMRSAAVFLESVLKKSKPASATITSPLSPSSRGVSGSKEAMSALRRSGAATSANLQEIVDVLLATDQTPTSDPRLAGAAAARLYYFRHFDVAALRFRVSYTPIPFVATSAVPVDPLRALHKQLGSMRPFLDCDEAHIRFSTVSKVKLLSTNKGLQKLLERTYKAEILSQAMQLLGTAKSFGNVLGVLNSVGIGFHDLTHEKSLSKGASSFLNNTAAGMSSGVEGLTASLGTKLASISRDNAYLSARQLHIEKDRPKSAKQGLKSGVRHFGAGLIEGVTGLVAEPVKGAKKGGFAGFMGGMGKGVIGAIVRPIVGFNDAVNKVSEGVKQQTSTAAYKIGGQAIPNKIERERHGENKQQQQTTPTAASASAAGLASPAPVPAGKSVLLATAAAAAASTPTAFASSSSFSAASPSPKSPSPSLSASSNSSSNSTSPSPATMGASSWRCPSCTFINVGVPQCVMCQKINPVSIAQPVRRNAGASSAQQLSSPPPSSNSNTSQTSISSINNEAPDQLP